MSLRDESGTDRIKVDGNGVDITSMQAKASTSRAATTWCSALGTNTANAGLSDKPEIQFQGHDGGVFFRAKSGTGTTADPSTYELPTITSHVPIQATAYASPSDRRIKTKSKMSTLTIFCSAFRA